MDFNWDTLASIATAIGVGVAAWQIRESKKLSQSSFEDSLDQQYRNLVMKIPVDALLGKPIPADEMKKVREIIYNYLDLCNEQAFLRKKNRISLTRWTDWNDGIKENLNRLAFKEVWEEVKKESPSSFSSLSQLEQCNFKTDPRYFNKTSHRK